MDETTFFSQNDVKVTNARFITGGQTYVMSNVTSVKTFVEQPKRFGLIVMLGIGLLVATQSLMVGGVIAAIAVLVLYSQRATYHVMLSTSSGETSALKTFQREYLNDVVSALNQAIVHRG